jgi:hypothetical protein
VFTGPNVKPAGLDFEPGSNLIYGASNTGKSFTLKSLDFMFGGQKQLPDFNERKGYEGIWLGFSLEGVGDFTLFRAISGGSYKLYDGLVKSTQTGKKAKILSQKHDSKKDNNLSQFLLNYLELNGKSVAKNIAGEQDSLSFRNLVEILLVNETDIQIERSPIESGNSMTRTKERSVFRLLLTGTDDSSIVTNVNENTFITSKTARLEMIGEMILDIESKLAKNYPNIDDLQIQIKLLDEQFEQIQIELELSQKPIIKLVEQKQPLSTDISKTSIRLEEVQLHIERFKQLEEVYISDIERLKALEEASFILSLGSDLDCPLCGAPAEVQKHTESLRNIGEMRNASLVEIKKIELQRSDLIDTVRNLESEKEKLKAVLEYLKNNLEQVEKEISLLVPDVNKNHLELRKIIEARDHARKGLSLFEQKNELFVKRKELNNLKKPSKGDNPKLNLPAYEVNEFCKVVSNVLRQWEFPGNCNVSFDYKTYDLRVDEKLRVDNGKGVRAIIHAAFKIALLLYCRDRGLPHPGFVVLDTPLLTYRDPMKNPNLEDLAEDEKALAKTSLKERFFEHLASIDHLGQIIILENIDPPRNIEDLAHVHLFYGNTGEGRYGLFPVSTKI